MSSAVRRLEAFAAEGGEVSAEHAAEWLRLVRRPASDPAWRKQLLDLVDQIATQADQMLPRVQALMNHPDPEVRTFLRYLDNHMGLASDAVNMMAEALGLGANIDGAGSTREAQRPLAAGGSGPLAPPRERSPERGSAK